ncbi:hypothetical protein CTI12_AA267330 [Artemisia annua]|uniref:KIB1-4 beta-propeller domain-containing protein n=1 Tax=Artemisia annua TaxID=35608 RepID=A0A2U1NGL9_ARTAN|nr:hypothetical protein CTI12_AA267330 [Artemisia annua]
MEWSEMLPELLDVLAHKHIVFYEDYLSFAGVCKSWHKAALQTSKGNNRPPSRLPSLMLSEKKGYSEFRDLFLLSNETIRKIRLLEAYGKLCMSSCGWLVTVGDDHASQLINPLSREIFNLPKIDTFPRFLETCNWDYGIRKLVFLLRHRKLGFCRIGESKWTPVEKGWRSCIYDITYYNGQVNSFDGQRHIQACDVHGKDPVLVDVERLPVDLFDYNRQDIGGAYIIGLDDGERKTLLVVIREGMFDDIDDDLCEETTYKTKSFQIFEYDLAKDTSKVIKGNCIYFTDDAFVLYRGSKNGGGRDMGIYHLCDGTIEPHFAGRSSSNLSPPIWLQSI